MPSETSTIRFERLETIDRDILLDHMADPRIAKHLPLLQSEWDRAAIDAFVASKAEHWTQHALGHWAILIDGKYAGWGGFERTDGEWDFGLVLRPECFGWGRQIARKAFDWARRNTAIKVVTFLLPLSRSQRALRQFGAEPIGYAKLSGSNFRKWRIRLIQGAF